MDPKDFYDAWAVDCPGAPPFTTDVLPYLNHLPRHEKDETWDDFVQRVDFERDQADRGTNLLAAIYPQDASERGRRFVVESDEEDAMDTVLSNAGARWPARSRLADDVFRRLALLTPVWSFIPAQHDPNSAEFLWARVRCVMAGAGYELHAEIASILVDLYPQCPLVADETRDEWDRALLDAHKNCGWPVQLGLVPWRDLTDVVRSRPPGQYVQEWHRVVSLLHVLKHLRVNDNQTAMVVVYRGLAAEIDLDKGTNVIGQMKKAKANLVSALGSPVGDAKNSHPLAETLAWALNHVTPNQLLRRTPLSELSGLVLAGQWSSLAPDPVANSNFVQHGCRLDGVWVAANGKVDQTTGDDDDVVSFAWNVSTAGQQAQARARRDLEAIMPKTFTVGYPSDVFSAAFPNLEWAHFSDRDAGAALFDAPVFASLLRGEVHDLRSEFPMVTMLPSVPSMDTSTNNGKSLLALNYARMLVPPIRLTLATDSASAPDIRAIADEIRNSGTICLDEWRMPQSKNHPLAREGLQSLMTGGTVSAGRVFENAGSIELRHSIVASAKALDYPPDMQNRTFAWFLSPLTDVMRANDAAVRDLKSGALALAARLGAIALCEQTGFVDLLKQSARSSSSQIRFGCHRTIAMLLYHLRTGRPDTTGAVDKAAAEAGVRFEAHCNDAEDNGVFSSLEEGRNVRLRLGSFFAEMPETDVQDLANYINFKGFKLGNRNHPVASVTTLIQGRMEGLSMHGQPFSNLLPFLCGYKMRTSNRQVVNALLEEIRRLVPLNGSWPLPGLLGVAGWHMFRFTNSGGIAISLEKVQPLVINVSRPTTGAGP